MGHGILPSYSSATGTVVLPNNNDNNNDMITILTAMGLPLVTMEHI